MRGNFLWLAPSILIIVGALGFIVGYSVKEAECVPRVETDGKSEFLDLINDYRVQNGLETFSVSPVLEDAAQWMANDMEASGNLSHTDSLGRDPFARILDFGYPENLWMGENLVSYATTPAGALESWKLSLPHKALLLSANMNEAGIGVSPTYWVLDTGSGAVLPTLPPPPPETLSPPPISLTPVPEPTLCQ